MTNTTDSLAKQVLRDRALSKSQKRAQTLPHGTVNIDITNGSLIDRASVIASEVLRSKKPSRVNPPLPTVSVEIPSEENASSIIHGKVYTGNSGLTVGKTYSPAITPTVGEVVVVNVPPSGKGFGQVQHEKKGAEIKAPVWQVRLKRPEEYQ